MANLNQLLQKDGQFPSIKLKIVPLDGPQYVSARYGMEITTFLEYRFKASVVCPISDFSFTFAYPSQNYPASRYIKEGDIAILTITVGPDDLPLATGIIDTIETQVTAHGETVSVMGRDMLGQWEDQGVYTLDGSGIIVQRITPQSLYALYSQNTRSQPNKLILQNISSAPQLVEVSPMESKLQVVLRYLEPTNCLVWCAPNGQIIWGKPNMVTSNLNGLVIVSRSKGVANALSMRSTRSAATVPQLIRPILCGQEIANTQVQLFPPVLNGMPAVARLASLGHHLHRTIVMSDPSGGGPSGMEAVSEVEKLGSGISRMKARALREMARENMRVLNVQSVMPGHLNENALPYRVDQNYQVIFDRDDIDSAMYLYEVEYVLTEREGPRTTLNFTYPNTIVAGNNYR